MPVLDIRHDLARLGVTLDDAMKRQLPFATALALTRSAYKARDDLKAAMQAAFDRPRPFTLNSTRVEGATKARLEANIHFRDFAPKGVQAGKYLRPQIQGGPRRLKSHEVRFRAAGLLPDGWFLVPTRFADGDGHGGLNGGAVRKMISALRASFDPSQNQGAKPRGKRAGESYFAIPPGGTQGRGGRGGGLPPGIYKVTGSAFGRVVRPVLAYTQGPPTYTARLDFDGVTTASFERHAPREIGAALEHAMRTARR